MLQIIYVSSANTALGPVDPDPIREVSQALNQRDSITGLLYSDGTRFMQALEGPATEVEACMARIARDRRHFGIVTLVRRPIDAREFAGWAMAHFGPGSDRDAFVAHVTAMVEQTSPSVRATFQGFVQERAKKFPA